jgi:hypothetical protein
VIARLRNTNPFNVYTLLTNTVYTSSCSIYYFNKEIKNGDFLILDATNLRPDVSLQLKNAENNKLIDIFAEDISIIDYNKLKVDTSQLSIPSGLYYVGASMCLAEGKLFVKGDPKKKEEGNVSVCSLKNIKVCNRTQLIQLLTDLLKKK